MRELRIGHKVEIERDELQLIQRVRTGEKALFHDLVRPYERGVYLAAHAILRNQADAEEVAQETMVKAFAHLDQLREDEKFKNWLFLIAMNEAKMRKRKYRQGMFESLDGEGEQNAEGEFMPRQFADWRHIPSEVLERKEIRAAIQRALEALDEPCRVVFLLRDVQHLTVAATAKALGISVAAVKTRLHRARLRMREQLAPAFQKRWTDRLTFLKGRNPW